MNIVDLRLLARKLGLPDYAMIPGSQLAGYIGHIPYEFRDDEEAKAFVREYGMRFTDPDELPTRELIERIARRGLKIPRTMGSLILSLVRSSRDAITIDELSRIYEKSLDSAVYDLLGEIPKIPKMEKAELIYNSVWG